MLTNVFLGPVHTHFRPDDDDDDNGSMVHIVFYVWEAAVGKN